jgi:cobalamin biosynthesis protein CobW
LLLASSVAAKQTLVRHLLQNNQGRRIAVVVNEFGEVGIDGELLRSCQVCDEDDDAANNIVELTNGCLCCTVQEEFLPTMQELLKRREQIDTIVIETSGSSIAQTPSSSVRWPEIRTGATVDGVVTVVDCEAVQLAPLSATSTHWKLNARLTPIWNMKHQLRTV